MRQGHKITVREPYTETDTHAMIDTHIERETHTHTLRETQN